MMLRRAVAIALLLAAMTSAARTARADDLSLELVKRAGQNVDLTKEPALKAQLVAAGLIKADATKFFVNSTALETVFARARFRNHVEGTRYHVGDRIMIEDAGSGGRFSPRAEIVEVLADGKYKVKVWDKAEPVGTPSLGWNSHVDALTDELANGRPIRVTVHNADGTTREETSRTPWLVRDNERTVTMTHEDIDKLNGRVEATGPYSVNGWKIDPKTDPVLAESIRKANAAADRIFAGDALTLPTDPAARAAKLAEIAKLQEKFLTEVFNDNFIEHPGNNPKANDRMRDYVSANPDMRGKIGAVIASGCGVCTDQAAAMSSILNEVGRRIGLTARAISGPTIKENAGHGFVALRFVDGKMGMYDVTWYFKGDSHPVDNMDFATWAGIPDSNRRINNITQPTSHETTFVDRVSEWARTLFRGYDKAGAEALLSTKAAELAETRGITHDKAAAEILSGNTGKDKLAGDFDVNEILKRARTVERPAADAIALATATRSRGLLDLVTSTLLRDRVVDSTVFDRTRGR